MFPKSGVDPGFEAGGGAGGSGAHLQNFKEFGAKRGGPRSPALPSGSAPEDGAMAVQCLVAHDAICDVGPKSVLQVGSCSKRSLQNCTSKSQLMC